VLDRGVPASLGRFLTPMIRGELYMVMIGTDSHKRTHTAVALDEVGGAVALRGVGAAEIVNRGWSDHQGQLVEGSQDP
jgi:hypothetical protein